MKRLAKQAARTARTCRRRTKMMGRLALHSHQMKPTDARSERKSIVRGGRHFHGTELPLEVQAKKQEDQGGDGEEGAEQVDPPEMRLFGFRVLAYRAP
jgi:hypothetical protein